MADNHNTHEDDEIIRHATEKTLEAFPPIEMSIWTKIGLILATILLFTNTVVSIYNSLELSQEIQCNHSLTNALNQISDQSRDITKAAIDAALGGVNPKTGKPLTLADLKEIKATYDAGFLANTAKRKEVLRSTCHDGEDFAPSTSSP